MKFFSCELQFWLVAGATRRLVRSIKMLVSDLPFEPEAMRSLGGPQTAYVGHPALEKYRMRLAQPAAGPILLLPGSRRGEITRHLHMMADVAQRLSAHPSVTGFIILSTRSQAARISRMVAQWSIPVLVVVTPQDRQSAIEQAIAAVAVSGTVTLELALAGVPHILTYVAEGAQVRMFKKATTRFIGLPNIIAGKEVIPEILFAHKGDSGKLADAAFALVDASQALAAQAKDFREIRALMEKGAPEAPLQDPVGRILAHI